MALGFYGRVCRALPSCRGLRPLCRYARHAGDICRRRLRGTFVLLVVQAAGWTTYGLLLQEAPIVRTNVCVLALTLIILVAKVRYG